MSPLAVVGQVKTEGSRRKKTRLLPRNREHTGCPGSGNGPRAVPVGIGRCGRCTNRPATARFVRIGGAARRRCSAECLRCPRGRVTGGTRRLRGFAAAGGPLRRRTEVAMEPSWCRKVRKTSGLFARWRLGMTVRLGQGDTTALTAPGRADRVDWTLKAVSGRIHRRRRCRQLRLGRTALHGGVTRRGTIARAELRAARVAAATGLDHHEIRAVARDV